MDEIVRVRNWPITVNYSFYIWLWLVNFLLLQPHIYTTTAHCRPRFRLTTFIVVHRLKAIAHKKT